MALVECVECKAEVSDKAAACPKCGAPIKAAGQQKTQSVSAAQGCLYVLVLIGIVIAISGYESCGCNQPAKVGNGAPVMPSLRAAAPAPTAEQAGIAARKAVDNAALGAAADAASAERNQKRKRSLFPAKPNGLDACAIDNKVGPLDADFVFDTKVDLAFAAELGKPLAQRFIRQVMAIHSCTALWSNQIEEVLLPALPQLADVKQLDTLVAVVGDFCASKDDASQECFARVINAMVRMTYKHR